MMLCGLIPVTDHSGRPISGVNILFNRSINYTLTTYNQRFTTPTDAVGKAGYLVSRVTILKNYTGTVIGASLDIGRGLGGDGADSKDLDILLKKSTFNTGEIYDTVFSLNSIPSFFRYFEFNNNTADYNAPLECRVELKLYY